MCAVRQGKSFIFSFKAEKESTEETFQTYIRIYVWQNPKLKPSTTDNKSEKVEKEKEQRCIVRQWTGGKSSLFAAVSHHHYLSPSLSDSMVLSYKIYEFSGSFQLVFILLYFLLPFRYIIHVSIYKITLQVVCCVSVELDCEIWEFFLPCAKFFCL